MKRSCSVAVLAEAFTKSTFINKSFISCLQSIESMAQKAGGGQFNVLTIITCSSSSVVML